MDIGQIWILTWNPWFQEEKCSTFSTDMVPIVTQRRRFGAWGCVGCFVCVTVGDSLKIDGTLNQHGYQIHSDMPSQLVCVQLDHHLFFNIAVTPITPPGCIRAGLQWDKSQSKGKKPNKCSVSLGTPAKLSKNHFRWLPHEPRWENAETVPSSKQRKAILKNLNFKPVLLCSLL